jgi:hypothetical protein
MTNINFLCRAGAAIGMGALVLGLATSAHAVATITIINNDGAGEGFNDPTPAAPVPGNPATTLGAQRLFIFNYAASIWGSILSSPVTIQVTAQMNPQTCTATSAVLGSTGSNSSHRDFTGAPFTGTWYQQSLANKLFGSDLNAAATDMSTTFNSNLNGSAGCLGGVGWYYGTDGNEGTNIELLSVVLHELSHGFGFASTTNVTSGAMSSGFPAAYDHFLYDDSLAAFWPVLTNAQRSLSAKSQKNLVWNSASVTPAAAAFLSGRPRMVINSPGTIAGVTYSIGTAAFGPALTVGGVTGDVVLVSDITAPTSDGCEVFTNGPALAGKIALVDRGVCTFVAKAESCQSYGAIAVVIANNTAGVQPPGGADPAITIPVVGILQSDGTAIKTALGSGPVNLTLNLDPTFKAGADNLGRPLMYTPATVASGSTVSHWDVTLTPNALMEPNINQDLHDDVDLTRYLLWDIGWFDAATATQLTMFTAADVNGGILLTWEFSDLADVGAITVERSTAVDGPWSPISVTVSNDGSRTQALDGDVSASTSYFYRLSVMDRAGHTSTYGLAAGRHAATVSGPAALFAPSPNPAAHGSSLSFRLTQPEFVRMSIVDASGRQVRTLANAMMLAGEHVQMWDGRGDSGENVAPGLYFVTMRTSKSLLSQRIAVVR